MYGLQHLTNNLNEDIHKSLAYFEKFWSQLKNFEALLFHRERRRRLVVSCIIGSARADEEHKLCHFSCQLYEKRWKCVVAFLKRLVVVMPLLRACWDEQKYKDGTDVAMDVSGASDEANPLGQLDLPGLTISIHDAFFNRYLVFALGVDDIAETKLASWGEGCICHEAFYVGNRGVHDFSSQYRRNKLLTHHFGKGISVCPMAGKKAPEMAAGRLYEVLAILWRVLDKEVFSQDQRSRWIPG